jgi:hypothetical protein
MGNEDSVPNSVRTPFQESIVSPITRLKIQALVGLYVK